MLRWADTGKDAYKNALKRCGELQWNVQCSTCAGRGYGIVKREFREGKKTRRVEEHPPCERCAAGRLRSRDEIWSTVRSLAAILTRVASDAPELHRVQGALEAGVRDAVALNPLLFRERLQDAAMEAIVHTKAVPGQSVAFLVREEEWPQDDVGDWYQDALPVRTNNNGRLLLVEAQARNVRGEARDALVVGTIAGTIRWNDEDWVVVERPLAVPMPTVGVVPASGTRKKR
ncbi:MAG: hypothetical protein R3F49_16090 [Planctomycetota bacterium]